MFTVGPFQIAPVFITIDPERDTPEVLKAYVASFDAPIIALTGSPQAVAQAAKANPMYRAFIAVGEDDREAEMLRAKYFVGDGVPNFFRGRGAAVPIGLCRRAGRRCDDSWMRPPPSNSGNSASERCSKACPSPRTAGKRGRPVAVST